MKCSFADSHSSSQWVLITLGFSASKRGKWLVVLPCVAVGIRYDWEFLDRKTADSIDRILPVIGIQCPLSKIFLIFKLLYHQSKTNNRFNYRFMIIKKIYFKRCLHILFVILKSQIWNRNRGNFVRYEPCHKNTVKLMLTKWNRVASQALKWVRRCPFFEREVELPHHLASLHFLLYT